MKESMKKFLELASSDDKLYQEVKALDERCNSAAEVKEAAIALARERGIELTDEDFERSDSELSEDELETVAGGDTCTCAVGGGGTGEEPPVVYFKETTCVCVIGGAGSYFKDNEWQNRCWCALAGGGGN